MRRILILMFAAYSVTADATPAPPDPSYCTFEDCGDGGGDPPPPPSAYPYADAYANAHYPTAQRVRLVCGIQDPGVASCSLLITSAWANGWIDCSVTYDPATGIVEGVDCSFLPIAVSQ